MNKKVFNFEISAFPSKREFEKWPLEAKKLAVDYIKLEVLKEIEIEPKIHLLTFTSPYGVSELKSKIKLSTKENGLQDKYKISGYGYFKNALKLKVSLYPRNHNFFKSKISTTFDMDLYDKFYILADLFPELSILKVEYTVDLKCRNDKVRNLFILLMRYLYIPHKKNIMFYNESKEENHSYYIGNKDRESKEIVKPIEENRFMEFKIYERGKDSDRLSDRSGKKKGWPVNSLDRVRMEYTLKTDELAAIGIYTFRDLLEDCRFSGIFNNSFDFRKFKDRTNKAPKEWEEYDKNSFQYEYLKIESENRSQFTEKAYRLDLFKKEIEKEVSSYQKDWIEVYMNQNRDE